MRCAHCGNDFKPTLPARAEQRFCSDYCRKRWHQLVHKRARYEAEVEAAEERMNGNGAHAPTIDVRSLLAGIRPPAPPPLNFKRRI
jgi:hypothetical protein